MAHARLWDLPGWKSPLNVKELAGRPGVGWFGLATRSGAVVADHAGNLYVRDATSLQPLKGTIHADWGVQAVHTVEGIALYIPKPAYANIRLEGFTASPVGYTKVAKILASPEVEDAAPARTDTLKPPTTAGWSVVPLKKNGSQVGTVKVAWGNGSVTLEFMDSYGAGQAISGRTFSGATGLSLSISPTGTSVSVL